MKTDLTMDDDQLARFIDLLSDRYKEDTWQSLADMVINAGLHALENMDDEKDNHPEESRKGRNTFVYTCDACYYACDASNGTSCRLTMDTTDSHVPFLRLSGGCPKCEVGCVFKLVKED